MYVALGGRLIIQTLEVLTFELTVDEATLSLTIRQVLGAQIRSLTDNLPAFRKLVFLFFGGGWEHDARVNVIDAFTNIFSGLA